MPTPPAASIGHSAPVGAEILRSVYSFETNPTPLSRGRTGSVGDIGRYVVGATLRWFELVQAGACLPTTRPVLGTSRLAIARGVPGGSYSGGPTLAMIQTAWMIPGR